MAQVSPRQEAEAYVSVTFHHQLPDGRLDSFEKKDCHINTVIYGLKQDYERQLGPPDSQIWYYNGVLLLNERTLQFYGIDGTDEIEIQVISSN